MNALHTPSMPSPALDPEAFLFEQLGLIRMHASLAQTYLEAGDSPGFAYSLKSLTARTRAVVGLVNDLDARQPEGRAHG